MQRQDISVTYSAATQVLLTLAHSRLGNQWQKQNTLQIPEDLQCCKWLNIHRKSSQDRAQRESLSPVLPGALSGGSCPGMAGQQGCGGLSRWGLETRSNPNAN